MTVWNACLVTALLGAAGTAAAAQQAPDVIRGRVTDDSSHVVRGATVKVTRGPDRLTLDATTDSLGDYRVRFEMGTGDYLVYVSAPGYRAARRRVQRQGAERELVADFALARDLTVLAAVKVTAVAPERASGATVSPTDREPGASERWSEGVNGQLPPIVAGNLGAIAGTFSNVGVTSGGPSILGSGPESNLMTLNGMGLGAGSIPRAARTETRVTGATFDPTRGGFAGANIDTRLEPGSREFQQRRAFLSLDPRTLQFADASSRSLGALSGGFSASAGADGEILRDVLTYSVSLGLTRSTSDPSTLLGADPDALRRAGLSSDSVARLIAVARPLGFPLAGSAFPAHQQHDALTWLGRIDDTRDTLRTRALTSYVELTRDGAVGFNALATPSTASERRGQTYGAQLLVGEYVGAGRRVLNETRLAASVGRTEIAPYAALPGANVLVRSSNLDTGLGVTGVSLGGASSLATSDARWSAETGNETDWNAVGRRHRFRALVWARSDGVRQEGVANGLGTFTYNSIADLAANRASSFSRTLTQPVRSGAVWNTAAALAHRYAPSRYFNVLYGARVEADGFFDHPAINEPLERALGVRSGAAPSRLHVSPRAGFAYTYNRDRTNGAGASFNQLGHFYRSTTGTIHGGIGEFRDLLRPGVLADASAATGLAGATSALSCVGSAVPVPDWTSFTDPGTIPTGCADGTGALGERAPSVRLIDPGYDVPRSWRVSLDWGSSVGKWLVSVAGLASYDLSQPGTVDANFAGVQRGTLAGEAGRPLYVTPAAIDPASGALSPAESRRSAAFGPVAMRVSDLRGYGGQLTFGVTPDIFRFRGGRAFFSSASYTVQSTRRQYRGFDGAAFGDPRTVEWSTNGNDARHVLVLSGGLATRRLGSFTMFARLQSGLPFTPLVNGDVNGDGRGGDRAFVPDPAGAADPALAAGIDNLLATGSPTARRCLAENLGRVPDRNGCRGPWTQSVNVQWRVPTPSRWGRHAYPNVYLQNVAAGLDQLFHRGGLRGWGSPNAPDPVLLVPRAFDAAAPRYRYDVNARFADTRPGRTLALNPFRVVVDFSFDLSTNFDLQRLRRAVEPVKTPVGYARRSADSLTSFYLNRTSDVYKLLISESDSLFLTPSQAAALQRADTAYSVKVRTLYAPLGQLLARGEGAAGKAELDSARATDKRYWQIFWEQPEIADSVLTPSQRELIPTLKQMLTLTPKQRETSRYFFGHAVTVAEEPRKR